MNMLKATVGLITVAALVTCLTAAEEVDNPETFSKRTKHANELYEQGKYAEAEQEYRAVLKLNERILGPEHPETLQRRNNLGNALGLQGRNAEAEQEYRAVLKIRERVLGPEHADTLQSRNNLAIALV